MHNKKHIFITGSTGLLGSTLLRLAPENVILGASYNVNTIVPDVQCAYYHVDITKADQVNAAIKEFKPDIIIHTAAIATPDYCDKHQEEANSVNVNGTENLIAACQKNGSSFVYITTNGVYDGKNSPYDEKKQPNPIDFYGKTKYEGEKMTKNSDVPYIIMRLITMYGWNNPKERQNPLTWLLKILGENKTPVNMVTDMYNNFLSVEEAAKAIWTAVGKEQFGETFNIAGKECISRYDFSVAITKIFGLDTSMLYPVTLDFFKNFVPRPKNTCFVTKKMQSVLQQKPLGIHQGLQWYKSHPLPETFWKKIL